MRDWEQEQERERREEETFRRIHRLIKRGYRIDWTVQDVEDAFWLEHPGNGPSLILYPDGKVVSLDKTEPLDAMASEDRDRIYNDKATESQRFDEWLQSVDLPSWRERTAADRAKYIWQPGCMILLILICWGVAALAENVWKAVTGP